MVEEMHLQENTLFDLDHRVKEDQGHTKCCPVLSTSCDLCTSKVWYWYIPWLRRRWIYKKIHYSTLTLGSRSLEMLPSSLDIMGPIHQQRLVLLHLTVKEKIHLQENTLFDLHHVNSTATKFEVALSNGLGGDIFTRNTLFDLALRAKVTRNVTQYPLHHVTYSATKFEVATSNGIEGDTYTRNVTDAQTCVGTDARTDKRTMDRHWY